MGAHLLARTIEEKEPTAVLVRQNSDTWRIRQILPNVTKTIVMGHEIETIQPEVDRFAPDVVINLAWSGVESSWRNDPKQVENLEFAKRLIDVSRESGCDFWIGIGSQAEYGPINSKVSENAVTQPTTVYGATKLSTCLVSKQMCEGYGMRFAWLRLFSSYGPMDNPRWLIPSLTLGLIHGDRVPLTKGDQLWDFLYASDVADAIIATARSNTRDRIMNLGSGKTHTIREVVQKIRDLVNPKFPIEFGTLSYREDQIMHLEADVSLIEQTTGWFPKVELDEGLKRTVSWYKENAWRYE